MEIKMTKARGQAFIRQLRFPAEVERTFQESYYSRMRSTVRASIFLTAGLSVLAALLHVISDGGFIIPHSKIFVLILAGSIHLSLVFVAFHRNFVRYWQSCLVVATLISLAALLFKSNEFSIPFVAAYFVLILFRLQRLQIRWLSLQLLGILILGAIGIISDSVRYGRWEWQEVAGISAIAVVLMAVPLMFTLRSERFERNEFLTKYVLQQERNTERQKREQTEKMLHILSQAIGGIVHDLGNPLTTVQGGAQTLIDIADDDDIDRELVRVFAEMITNGAQMLNYLRLSLLEQTRVLEGKAVPVELKSVSLRELIEAGAHYQKPKFAAGRHITFDGEDIEVCVDEMRIVTVFMNLIGNALKYSDGEVRIKWCLHDEYVLIAILDQGKVGKGISREEADNLFVPFGRLDNHAQIEGTGLGLLSVRQIAEAHEGEVYIEGYTDGTSKSLPFSTAQSYYPPTLEDGFLTAFVTACPQRVKVAENANK
ncbi:hypothetical protein EON83_16640 [bacterium]|nr:MAG: hypothetical protein EON83_16640 [bacterium]